MKKISKIIKGVPSSFVFKNMKLDTDKGAGEAKLFVGPKSQIEDINDFLSLIKRIAIDSINQTY